MSKKDKSKFHKRIKAQILQEMAQAQSQSPKPTVPLPPQPSAQQHNKTVAKPAQQPTVPKIDTEAETPNESINYFRSAKAEENKLVYVKKDLKKSAIIIGSIIIIIVGLSIADSKTNILLKAGNQVFRVLHIGTQ